MDMTGDELLDRLGHVERAEDYAAVKDAAVTLDHLRAQLAAETEWRQEKEREIDRLRVDLAAVEEKARNVRREALEEAMKAGCRGCRGCLNMDDPCLGMKEIRALAGKEG
jgi:flagellar motility protein MotE (MotC chaperone)